MPQGSYVPVLEEAPVDPGRDRSPCWSRFAVRTCGLSHVGPVLATCSEGLHPVEMTHAGADAEELHLVGVVPTGEFHGGLSLMGEMPCGAGEACEVLSL